MSGSPPRSQWTFPLTPSLSKGRLGVLQEVAKARVPSANTYVWPPIIIVVAATVAFSCAFVGCERGITPPPDVAALEVAVRRFHAGMASKDPLENRDAMAAMVPERDDFAALFPGRDETLWGVWEPERRALLENATAHSVHYRSVLPLGAIHVADLREEGSVVLQRSLEELPGEVPALGVRLEVSGPARERVASTFVFVRGRWIWIWDLERAGALVTAARGTKSPGV